MIPAWLTLKSLKLGIIGAIILAIFSAGWYVKGRLTINKIVTLERNYDLCYENLRRSNANWLGLKDAVEETNAEVIKQNIEYNARVIKIQAEGRDAIRRLNASHDEAIADSLAESDRLRLLMEVLPASEACDLAMREIVQ